MSETETVEASPVAPKAEVGDITFHNVTLTFEGMTGQEAYNAMCMSLGTVPGCGWKTDTFTRQSGDTTCTGEVSEFWPPID